jgi:CTP synthase (UTP-ammonia lyase)
MLKDKGLVVAPIKMEGYLNIDSGTLNPYRHGEVFVLEDGTECDMDLGTYERMLDQNLSRAATSSPAGRSTPPSSTANARASTSAATCR